MELVARGPQSEQTWTHPLSDGQVVRIGRAPQSGWAVPWDGLMAVEHLELAVRGDQVHLRRLPGSSGAIRVAGMDSNEWTLGVGDQFETGQTSFELVALSPAETPTAASGSLAVLGKYQIIKKLGAGGMGAVYLAVDTDLKRKVALKVLDREKSRVGMFVQRFRAEAKAASNLHHENIVAVYDSGSIDGNLYIALEYIQGIDVENLLEQRGPLSVKRSLDIVKQVTRALQHAHEQGIVHRDIKPSNLMITKDGTVKLTDMGLARSLDETLESGITRAGTTVGTVDYMAPEQARSSKAADVRSDIYSLGCTWYHMLTGSAPYPEGSITNKLHAHATRPIPDPRDKDDRIPEAMVAVLQRMMAKSPEDRYQTPGELLEDLENRSLTREGLTADLLAALAEEQSEEVASPAATQSKSKPPVRPRQSAGKTTASTHKASTETAPVPDPSALESPTPLAVPLVTIRVKCPECGKSYKAEAKASGKRVRCPKCGAVMTIGE